MNKPKDAFLFDISECEAGLSETELGKSLKTGRIVRVRTCVGCKKQDDAHNMLRIVFYDSELTVDFAKSLPGRGAWIHSRQQCVTNGVTRRAIVRALRVDVQTDTKSLENRFKEIMDNQK